MNKNNQGFTLLELLIAIAIMAFISIFTGKMIQNGIKSRAKVISDLDARGGISSALQLMMSDISKAFNYRDVHVELYNAAQKQRREKLLNPTPSPTPQGGIPPSPGTPTAPPRALTAAEEEDLKPKEVKVFSRFIGDAERLDFTSLDLHRIAKDQKVSDQVEIGYYLEKCTSRTQKNKSTNCLWRRYAQVIDDDIRDGGRRSVLLEDIKTLKFRYLAPTGDGTDDIWRKFWLSEGGSSETKNKFPLAVEITIVINDNRTDPPREIGMTVAAPIEFPNNVDEKAQANATPNP